MCMLTYFPAGASPDGDALYNGTIINRDGHGFAIVSDNRLIIRHDMNGAQLVEVFEQMRKQHPDGPALFHSRLGTGGAFTRFNCHPFRFGGDRRTVLAHNGILPAAMQPDREDKRCDTRYAAEVLIPRWFGNLSDPANRDRLGTTIGLYNKLVILTVNPIYDAHAYLINEKSGIWDDGIWYSNTDYRPRPYRYGTTGRYSMFEPDLRCAWCGRLGRVDAQFWYCTVCGICVDCGNPWSDGCTCQTVIGAPSTTPTPADQGRKTYVWADKQLMTADEYVEGHRRPQFSDRPSEGGGDNYVVVNGARYYYPDESTKLAAAREKEYAALFDQIAEQENRQLDDMLAEIEQGGCTDLTVTAYPNGSTDQVTEVADDGTFVVG